jgi:hypothetical protein
VVKLEDGRFFKARRGVLCVGAWAEKLYGSSLCSLGVSLRPVRKVLHWFEPNIPSSTSNSSSSGNTDQNDDPFRHIPCYIWDDGDFGVYGFPRQRDREGVKVGLGLRLGLGLGLDFFLPLCICTYILVYLGTCSLVSIAVYRVPLTTSIFSPSSHLGGCTSRK